MVVQCMAKEKQEFTKEYKEVILEALVTAPCSQLSARLKQESIDLRSSVHTLQQTYDFCNYISKQPEIDAGPFVRTLCDVAKYYQRPA